MRYLFPFLMACVLLRVASTVVAILFVGLLLLFLWSALFRPRQTFGLLAFLLLANLVEAYPGWTLLLLAALAAMGLAKADPTEPTNRTSKAITGPRDNGEAG